MHCFAAIAREWAKLYNNKDVTFESAFTCEKGPKQQDFLRRHFPDCPHMFGSMGEFLPRPPVWTHIPTCAVSVAQGQ